MGRIFVYEQVHTHIKDEQNCINNEQNISLLQEILKTSLFIQVYIYISFMCVYCGV